MGRELSEMWVPFEEKFATSANSGDVKTLRPTTKRAVGALVTVEGAAARVTFTGNTPGAGAPPGNLIPTATPPLFYPFNVEPGVRSGPIILFASNTASPSTVSVTFVE